MESLFFYLFVLSELFLYIYGMKHEQAYIKLASLRLAINYVLRNRAMTKSASEWTNPLIGAGVGMGLGYLLSPEKHKLLGTLGGGVLGGAAGYGFNQLNKPSPKNKPNPEEEYGYLYRLEDATASNAGGLYPDNELVDESNNRLSSPIDLVSRMFYSDVSPEEVAKSSNKYYEIYNDHPYKEQIGEPKENNSEPVIDTPKETKSNKPFDINAILNFKPFGSKEKGVPTPAGAPYPIELYEEEANKLIPLPKQRFSILEKTEDTSKEEPTSAPVVPTNEDYRAYQQELAKEKSNNTEEPTKSSFTPSTLEDVVNTSKGQADPGYKGIKPEYHWLVNLERVLFEGFINGKKLENKNPGLGVYGPSRYIYVHGPGYSLQSTPIELARSLSVDKGHPDKLPEEAEKQLLQQISTLFAQYNNEGDLFDSYENKIGLPAYPVSDPVDAKKKQNERNMHRLSRATKPVLSDEDINLILPRFKQLLKRRKEFQDQVNKVYEDKREREIRREKIDKRLPELSAELKKAKQEVGELTKRIELYSKGSMIGRSKEIWVKELGRVLKKIRELENEEYYLEWGGPYLFSNGSYMGYLPHPDDRLYSPVDN